MKTEYGFMPCRECGQEVKVMENEKKTLSYSCSARGCDDHGYAQTGTLKHASWLKAIKKFEVAENTNPPTKTAAPKPLESDKNTTPIATPQPKEKKASPNTSPNMWGL